MTKLDIIQIPVLSDNYIYLAHDTIHDQTTVIDPAVAEPVLEELAKRSWTLNYIWNTHHHADHVGANLELKKTTGCEIIGPEADMNRIPGIDHTVKEGDEVKLGDHRALVFDVPGHTRGHIAYWLKEDDALFCGDTLFSMGCGRLFEGTPAQMWNSLQKIKDLPDATRVFCAHEYTLSNGTFALTIDPDNHALKDRMIEVRTMRETGIPTVPSTMETERATNPFLRPDNSDIAKKLGMEGASIVDVFAEIRKRKDHF